MSTDGREGEPGRRGAAARTLRRGIYAIVDLEACEAAGVEPIAAARALCREPLAALQIRAKRADDRTLAALARETASVCRAAGVPFVVNDRADVARLAGADGVHVGQDDLPPDRVRALLGPGFLVGLSTHSPAQIDAAARAPLDYVGFGPVFTTRTKERAHPVVGLDGLREAVRRSRFPVVAIGGIRVADLAAVRDAGAHAAALVSALFEGRDPAARIREAVEAFGPHSGEA